MIQLFRYGSSPMGTFGELYIAGEFFSYTVEQPWNNNKPYASCVPSGEYGLVPHQSNKYGFCLALVNHDLDVGHWEGDAKRFAIIIHPANFADELAGCIALGDGLSGFNGKWAVTNSRQTIQDFYSLVDPQQTHPMEISWRDYD